MFFLQVFDNARLIGFQLSKSSQVLQDTELGVLVTGHVIGFDDPYILMRPAFIDFSSAHDFTT